MDYRNVPLSGLVCRRVLRDDLSSVSLTNQMLTVLVSLDGKESLAGVAARLGLSPGTARDIAVQLQELGLIEAVRDALPVLRPEFISLLRSQLSLAIGPIADVVLEDAFLDLGHSLDQFPAHRTAELIDLLSREIQRDEKRLAFQKRMLQGLGHAS